MVKGKESHVYRLKKALYGLRESARLWFNFLSNLMKSIGLSKSSSDNCFYFGHIDNHLVLIVIFVNDLLIASSNLIIIIIKLLNKTYKFYTTVSIFKTNFKVIL